MHGAAGGVMSRYADCAVYVTKDGSSIRELMHPDVQGNANQSLAEAVVAPGTSTRLHRHRLSEEIYYVTGGEGCMQLGAESFSVKAGDVVCIPPGEPHCLTNTGEDELRVLCACAPPYSHDDTELLDGAD